MKIWTHKTLNVLDTHKMQLRSI